MQCPLTSLYVVVRDFSHIRHTKYIDALCNTVMNIDALHAYLVPCFKGMVG